jgi:ammonium transporter
MVWAMNWWGSVQVAEVVDGVSQLVTKDPGTAMVGFLGKMGALDFAGGTVVHIAAGFSALAAIVVLRKRIGYPEHSFHPNSMVLTLLGAGLLWFGWFGFNGGSAGAANKLASSAFAATQAAAAAAALSWMCVEWMHRGKPTALGLASGVVAGLVAVTPAAGFIYVWGGLAIGLIAGVVCYLAVCLKPVFKYDDSLDAFGVHGVGGFLGAVLTGVFCYAAVNVADGMLASIFNEKPKMMLDQTWIQIKAAAISAVFAFLISALMVKAIDEVFGFIAEPRFEIDGLDRAEHGEVGFDLGLALESSPAIQQEAPKAASVPPNGQRRFTVVVDGPTDKQLRETWSKLCQTGAEPPSAQFKAVYPYMTTVEGNRFHFRGGDPHQMSDNLRKLFQGALQGYDVKARVEDN